MVDRDLEEPLDLRAVQVEREDPVRPRRLDAVGRRRGARIETRGSSFLSPLAYEKKGITRRDLGMGAGRV